MGRQKKPEIGLWMSKKVLGALVFGATLIFATLTMAAPPPGATTAPYRVMYTAKLTNSTGTPITTAQTVRFSLWTDADWDAGDIDGAGNINTLSFGYAGWQETYTVTPNADGIFTVELGSTNTFPNFTSTVHAFLEVDVKPSASPLTAFEVLDPDGNTGNLTDRKPFNSAPYAINSDTVDNHDVGTGPGNIPVLDGTGKLTYGLLPDGVNADTFTLDIDNNAPTNQITLQFGTAVAEYLRWNDVASTFQLSDSLDIGGDLTFSGTGNITGATIDGTLNTLQNIPFTAIAPHAKKTRLSPEYPGAALKADGTGNNGIMAMTNEDLGGALQQYNYYLWTTNKPAAQDLDIKLRYQLPSDFVSFAVTPLELTYQTTDGNPLNNSVDLSVQDAAGAAVALAGATGLASATWSTTGITFTSAPTMTADAWIEITIKATATAGNYAKVGDLVLNYNGR